MKYTIEAKPYGEYDVVVCGGGTAGVCAAIAAAREGVKTLLIERSFTVGGMLTVGEAGITKFSEHCKDVDKYKKEVLDVLGTEPKKVQVVGGIAHEYVMRMLKNGKALGTNGDAGSYIFTDKAEAQWVLIQMLDEAGVEVLYDTRVCLVKKDGDTVTGVVVHNKEGFCEISAKQVIDTMGDADVAALAGVPFHKGACEDDIKEGFALEIGQLHGSGVMFRVSGIDFEKIIAFLEENPNRIWHHPFGNMSIENIRESYRKGDMVVFGINGIKTPLGPRMVQIYNLPKKDEAILMNYVMCSHEGDGLNARSLSEGQNAVQKGVRDLCVLLRELPGFENLNITYVPDIGVRETRHIVGEYVINALDVLTGKDFPDSIACGGHPIDVYPQPAEVRDMDMNHWRFHMPYRIMLPKNAENLLVAGRSISATRGASGSIRPTAQCMALGEAAGVAAAMAVKGGLTPKTIDVKVLREKLVEKGAII